jgi:hypothetical protein
MEPRKLIEPAVIQYLIEYYRQNRDQTIPQKIYKGVTSSISLIFGSIETTFLKKVPSIQDIREDYCKKFFKLADKIKIDNITRSLIVLGTAADEIQRTSPTQESDFTSLSHAIRTYILYKTIGPSGLQEEMKIPEKTTPLTEKEEFIKSILSHQNEFKDQLILEIEKLKNAKEKKSSDGTCTSIQNDIKKLDCKLAYLGWIKNLVDNTYACDFLFPSHLYPRDDNDPLPFFPSMLQPHFIIIKIHSIYKRKGMQNELVDKNDDEILSHFEEYAKKEMEIERAKKIEQVKVAEEKARKSLSDAEEKLRIAEGSTSVNTNYSDASTSASQSSTSSSSVSSSRSSSSSSSSSSSASSSSASSVPSTPFFNSSSSSSSSASTSGSTSTLNTTKKGYW